MDAMDRADRSPAGDPGASRGSALATACGVGVAVSACAAAMAPTIRVLAGGRSPALRLPWDATHGAFRIALDPLGAFFLLPVLVLSALAAVYGGAYLLAYGRRKSLGLSWFFFNTFLVGMAGVILARTALLFVICWEVMSLSAYFLVTFEQEKAEVRRAGWIYLVATHLGVACLIGLFATLGWQAGGLEFEAFERMPAPGAAASAGIFLLALAGFGAKAGFVPFHVWLPEAHPAAPSHVSALMSGAMIKMGLYGILRVLTFLGPPAAWWGATLASLGLLTAVVGVSMALHQRDLKRVLAYSSIENVGLIGLALGIGLWGRSAGQPVVAALGMTAALLHIWNHALMKGLMFLSAGSVLHATATRDLEQLGGLMKRMPMTGAAMTLGAVAISALPPLNGFVGEWLMYLGLMRVGASGAGGAGLAAMLAVGVLAMIGGLASLTFARLVGVALLGSPRGEAAGHAHESSVWMLAPMGILAGLCLVAGVSPRAMAGLSTGALSQLLGGSDERAAAVPDAAAPLGTLGAVQAALLVAGSAAAMALRGRVRWSGRAEGPTWGCGYARPTPRMQYTGRSFSEMLAEHLLPRLLRPRTRRHAPRGWFPRGGEFTSESPDPIAERFYEPLFRRWADRCARLRILQQGKVHVYLLYIVLTVVMSLAWVLLREG